MDYGPRLLADAYCTAPELMARVYCAGSLTCEEYVTPDQRNRERVDGTWRCAAHETREQAA